jgi:phage major head subunit gpT-like protein
MPTLQLETRTASIAPTSLNREAGTIDVVISTGAAVQRRGFIERLNVAPEAVTVAPHLPVLDSHRQGSIADVKGRVERVWFETGRIMATLKISDPAALDAIERGDVTGVSIGYGVSQWEETAASRGADRVKTAKAWTLREVSLVAIPADPSALIRSPHMSDVQAAEPVQAATPPELQTRAEIRTIARQAGLTPEWADEQIDAGADLTAVRSAAFEAMRNRSPVIRTQVVNSAEDPETIRNRQVDALAARMSGGTPTDAARPFMNFTLADYARDALTRSGAAAVGFSREELLTRAMHTTSDFPELLTGAGNRVLAGAYQAAQSPLKAIARQRTAADFRPMSTLKTGDFAKLNEVTESGEITSMTTGEAVESYSLKTFGGIFSLTRKALINDDLGAMGQWSAAMGRAAAETEADQLVSLLTQASGVGPTMEDGKALFHADHGNLAASGAAPSVATLDAARLAMRTQRGLDGVSPINVPPKFLLVAPDLETTAEQLLAALAAATVDDQNPFAGRLTLLVEPRLTPGDWYVFADPAAVPCLEYAYLSSAQGPQMSSRDGWETLGREFRIVLDFGCGATDWRGAYRNPGA